MKNVDLLTFYSWLSPDVLIPMAEAFGRRGFPGASAERQRVFGAELAYKQLRSNVRDYIKFVRHRDGVTSRDLDVAQSLRSMGFVGNFQPVYPIETSGWRSAAISVFSNQSPSIPGGLTLPCNVPFKKFQAAFLRGVCDLFYFDPKLNLALLQGNIWARTTPHVLLTVAPGENELRMVAVNAANLPVDVIREKVFKATKGAIKSSKHEYSFMYYDLLKKWAGCGFIASPGAATVSFVDIEFGYSALATNLNGVPITFTVGKEINGSVKVGINVDHRVFDGSHVRVIHEYLLKNIVSLQGD